ncbi:hypothetical protein M1328_02265 [Patescibacteria group bacterium]|nr:hypothetical protein [Patescibacteria group bacterium]
MSGLNKVYLSIFIFLVLVLVGELGYLFYQSSFKPKSSSVTQTISDVLTATPAISKFILPTGTPTATDAATVSFVKTELDVYKNMNALGTYYRLMADKGILISSLLTVKMGGELVKIDDKGGVLPVTNFPFQVMISFKKGDEIQSTYLSASQVKLVQVVKIVDGKEQSIPFTDLKIGDNITLEKTRSLLDRPDLFTEFKITKL